MDKERKDIERKDIERRDKERKNLYITGWYLLAGFLCLLFTIKVTQFDYEKYSLPCILNYFTGFYCPGCGGTRAVIALLHGNIAVSLQYHPIVLYVALLFFWYMTSNTIELLSKGRWKIGMYYHNRYLYLGLAILVVNCLVKNIEKL